MAPPVPQFEFSYHNTANSLEAPLGKPSSDLEALAAACDSGSAYTAETWRIRGKWRSIAVPSHSLDGVQREISRLIFPVDRAMREEVNGYVARRSTLTNAAPHAGAAYLQKFDIASFFDSITSEKIDEALGAVGFGPGASNLIARLVSFRGRLPLGSRTSPRISNLVLWDFDEAMAAVAASEGVRYTRYADDLSFSASMPFDVGAQVAEALLARGFELNSSKTKRLKQGQPMFVTGLAVSDAVRPRVRKRLKRRLRQELYFIEKLGLGRHAASTGREPGTVASRLSGQLYYVRSIEPDVTRRLAALYPSAFQALVPERADDRVERTQRHREAFLAEVEKAPALHLPMYVPCTGLS